MLDPDGEDDEARRGEERPYEETNLANAGRLVGFAFLLLLLGIVVFDVVLAMSALVKEGGLFGRLGKAVLGSMLWRLGDGNITYHVCLECRLAPQKMSVKTDKEEVLGMRGTKCDRRPHDARPTPRAQWGKRDSMELPDWGS